MLNQAVLASDLTNERQIYGQLQLITTGQYIGALSELGNVSFDEMNEVLEQENFIGNLISLTNLTEGIKIWVEYNGNYYEYLIKRDNWSVERYHEIDYGDYANTRFIYK